MGKQDSRKRNTRQLDTVVDALGKDLESHENPELTTFRVSTLVEYVCVYLLATRLAVSEDDLPNLDYTDLVTLALSGERYAESRERALRLGEVRNYLAHYLDDRVWLEKVAAFVSLMGLSTPKQRSVLLGVFRLAMFDLFLNLLADVIASVPQQTLNPEQRDAILKAHEETSCALKAAYAPERPS